MKYLLLIVGVAALSAVTISSTRSRLAPFAAAAYPQQQPALNGRWRVKFNLSGIGEKNLTADFDADGSASLLLLDAGPDNKAAAKPIPGAWSQTTNGRVSFSAEVELPYGTCCREIGTLVFKGKFDSQHSLSGKAVFIGTTTDDENYNGFRSTTGTFTAVATAKQ